MTYPGVIFWIIAIAAILSRGPLIYGLFFATWSLGTLAVIPPEVMPGVSFTPAWIVAGIITAKVFFEVGPKTYLHALFDFRRFGFLTLCTIYALVSAVLLPRLFEGQVNVVIMKLKTASAPEPLLPSIANFTQSFYLFLTNITVVSFYFACRDADRRRQLLVGFGWGAGFAILSGLADFVLSGGASALLAPFRNATYVIEEGTDTGDGLRRIIGLMSEPSAYAALCISFLTPLALVPAQNRVTPWGPWRVLLVLAMLYMIYLSASSGGYVAVAAFGIVFIYSVATGMMRGNPRAWLGGFGILAFITLLPGLILLAPRAVHTVYHLVDIMVFHKTESGSYAERSMWNRVAFQAFLHTDLLGAGLGSVRASSWVFALLSNIGLPGVALLVIYMLQVYLSPVRDRSSLGLLRAAKLAIIPNLVVVSLSGTSVGFGLGVAWLFGLASAIVWSPESAAANARRPPAPSPVIATGGGLVDGHAQN